ncbi:hypothetical protein KAS50_04930, partial [bacterium]|nr:hypothetical protein [bacterium]
MNILQLKIRYCVSLVIYLVIFSSVNNVYAENEYTWDISPFGDLCYWSDNTGILGKSIKQNDLIEVPQSSENEWNIGVWWKEERDINRIEIIYDKKIYESLAKATKVQYWFQTWPGEP